MKLMIPFYYILAALLFGLIGGFYARCYQHSDGDFFCVLPLMHTMLIESFCFAKEESESQIISFGFKKSESGKRALEDLREIIFLVR